MKGKTGLNNCLIPSIGKENKPKLQIWPPGLLCKIKRLVNPAGIPIWCPAQVMFLYAMFVLGKRNKVEHRTYLALAGIVACFMGLMISLGLTMAFGFYYTTLHGILPFMALGK